MIEVTDCLFLPGNRETDGEFHQAFVAAYMNVAMMGQDDGPGNGKAQTVMVAFAVAGRVCPVEPLKELFPLLGRDFVTPVDDGKDRRPMVPGQLEGHFPLTAAVADGKFVFTPEAEVAD